VLVIFFFLSGCTKQIRPTIALVKQDTSLGELVTLYKARLKRNQRFKMLMEVKADLGGRGKHRFQASWRSDREKVQIQGFNLFGGSLFDLTLNGSSFFLDIPPERKSFEGELDFFSEAVGIDIPFGSLEFLEWVRRGGGPEISKPLIPALEKGNDHFVLYLFTLRQGNALLREKIWIERAHFHIIRVERFDLKGIRQEVIEFSDYRQIEGRDFPFLIHGSSTARKIRLSLRELFFRSQPLEKR